MLDGRGGERFEVGRRWERKRGSHLNYSRDAEFEISFSAVQCSDDCIGRGISVKGSQLGQSDLIWMNAIGHM
jgi:hypothetical protein